jgi:hypothetical protein
MKATLSHATNIRHLFALTFILLLIACNSSDDCTTRANNTSNISTGGTGNTPSWVAPVERTDNSSFSIAEIAGYRIYYGTAQGNYSQHVLINDTYADEYNLGNINLPAGTYYAVMTTVDTDGRESSYSQELVFNV